ncbi:HAD family hydrolase [Synergistaceae bacterium OttesenSCG-928-D05]|nr:HAD family hydrolase [Synergistaceae bacterium OttesenSCG-928-D05]
MDTEKITPDALIFDIDGVLINVEKSFPEVIRLSVLRGWEKFCGGESDAPGYTPAHERILKRHGAFNDDYDIVWLLFSISAATGEKKLSRAFPSPEKLQSEISRFSGDLGAWVQERYGALVSRSAVRADCSALYTGEMYKLESPMLRCHWKKLPLPTAIYTGRDAIEWELAKKTLGWEDFPSELIIHSDSGIRKPSPKGLEILCGRLGVKNPLFFGDTASDMQALATFENGYFVAIGDLLPEAKYIYKNPELALGDLLNFKIGGDINGRK